MPNSLIFVIILAVWAAYLIQHWIRRRDHVATARSVDRFSEAMRVLERRQSAPRADISTPAPRSYAVSLTRPAHPDVVVKRARHGAAGPEPRRTRRRLHRPAAATVRAALLVIGVFALATGASVWALGLAPWWAAAAGAATLLLAVTGVRFSVSRQRRRAASPVRPQTAQSKVVATRTARAASAPKAARAPRVQDADQVQAPTGPEVRPARTVAHAGPRDLDGRAPELYDVEAHDRAPAPVMTVGQASREDLLAESSPTVSATLAEQAGPGTWAPVAVPPPTYTLKARATRPGAGGQQAAEAAREDQDLPSFHEQVADLPFDGNALAFDEEFEDLPPVHSVG